MNEHDSSKMTILLQSDGYLPTENPKEADIILFNTCTIRNKSHHKAISEVGKALKRKKRDKDVVVGVTGCVAQEERENLYKLFPELDLVVGPDQIWRLPKMLSQVLERRGAGVQGLIHSTELVNKYEDYKFVSLTPTDQQSNSPTRISEYITIIKGCNNFCTFCIVPYVRGREVSKSPDDIVNEIKQLTETGVREVTLLGQNVNSYGRDKEEFGDFSELLKRISEETNILRIRYTSPHPKDLSDKLIAEHKTNRALCEHIHLPVQAGSTTVLKRMSRGYSREDYIEKINEIRKMVPDVAISTDIIVGFAGETDEEFQDTLSLMREVQFDGMFAFKYSERSGTKAAEKFKDDVPERVKLDRLSQVLELNGKIVLQKNEKYVGTTQEVLVEGPSKRGNEQLNGRTRTNKIVNFDNGDKIILGELVNIEITWAGPNSLKGVAGC